MRLPQLITSLLNSYAMHSYGWMLSILPILPIAAGPWSGEDRCLRAARSAIALRHERQRVSLTVILNGSG